MKFTFSQLASYTDDGVFSLQDGHFNEICHEIDTAYKGPALPICVVTVIGPPKSGKTFLLRAAMQKLVTNFRSTEDSATFQPSTPISTSTKISGSRLLLLTPPLEGQNGGSKLLVYGLDIDYDENRFSIETYNKLVEFALTMSSIVIFSVPTNYNPKQWDAIPCFEKFRGNARLQKVGFAVYHDDPASSDQTFIPWGANSLPSFLEAKTVDDVRKNVVQMTEASFQTSTQVYILPHIDSQEQTTDPRSYHSLFLNELLLFPEPVNREGFILNTHNFSATITNLCINLNQFRYPGSTNSNPDKHIQGIALAPVQPNSPPAKASHISVSSPLKPHNLTLPVKNLLLQLKFELACQLMNSIELPHALEWEKTLMQRFKELPQDAQPSYVGSDLVEYQQPFLEIINLVRFYRENMTSFSTASVCVSPEEFRNQHETICTQVYDQLSPSFRSPENNFQELLQASLESSYSWYEEDNNTRYTLETQLILTAIDRIVSKYKAKMSALFANQIHSIQTLTTWHHHLSEISIKVFLLSPPNPSNHHTTTFVLPALWQHSKPKLEAALNTEFKKTLIENSNKLQHYLQQRNKVLKVCIEKYENILHKASHPPSAHAILDAQQSGLAFFDQETSSLSQQEYIAQWLQTFEFAMGTISDGEGPNQQHRSMETNQTHESVIPDTCQTPQPVTTTDCTPTSDIISEQRVSSMQSSDVEMEDVSTQSSSTSTQLPLEQQPSSNDQQEKTSTLLQELETQLANTQLPDTTRDSYTARLQQFHTSLNIPDPSQNQILQIEKAINDELETLDNLVQQESSPGTLV